MPLHTDLMHFSYLRVAVQPCRSCNLYFVFVVNNVLADCQSNKHHHYFIDIPICGLYAMCIENTIANAFLCFSSWLVSCGKSGLGVARFEYIFIASVLRSAALRRMDGLTAWGGRVVAHLYASTVTYCKCIM